MLASEMKMTLMILYEHQNTLPLALFSINGANHIDTPLIHGMTTQIDEQMRSNLTDWLVEGHLKLKLISETFYLTINLIN